MGDVGAEHGAEREADRDAEREDRQRAGAAARLEIIGNQRIGRRNPPASPMPTPMRKKKNCQNEVAVPHKPVKALQNGDRRGDDPAAAGAVGEKGEGNAEDRVEDGERRTAERAELPVVEVQVGDDRAGEDAEDLPVEIVEDVGDEQKREDERRLRRSRSRIVVTANPPSRSISRSTSPSS